jgi:hypothetical protein
MDAGITINRARRVGFDAARLKLIISRRLGIWYGPGLRLRLRRNSRRLCRKTGPGLRLRRRLRSRLHRGFGR